MEGQEFNHHMQHPNETMKVALNGLTPNLEDYIMNAHDPCVEDFVWSMDDSRHTESVSKELTEIDVPKLLLFADKDVIQAVRTSSASAAAEVAGRKDELSSSNVLDVTVFNLGNLARQTIQRQAEPRMLRLIINQTSYIMMLVESTSLAVNQWDKKLQEANWTLSSSDDGHHWPSVRNAEHDTKIRKLVDNCGSEHQKI